MHAITYGKPALDEVHDFTARRVFDDNSGDPYHLWFETSPGRFRPGTNWVNTLDWSVTFEWLMDQYPGLTDVAGSYR
jgi:hypothetical protein